LLARNITGQYEGRTASACPGQAIMTESRSTAAHRKTVAALAILALACQPCGAFPTALGARAISDVPTDGPTDDPPLPRRRRPERHDGVHQRADSQRGVVTGYVALLSPAKRAATPRGLPAVRPFRVRARGRGVAESRPVPDRDTISFRPDGRRRDECARDARTTRTAFRVSFPDSRRPSGYGAMRTPSRVTAHAPRSRAFRPRRDDFRERQGEPADWRAGQRRELVSGHRVRVRRERRAT